MEVSPGVIVREGDRVKKGPKQVITQHVFVSALSTNVIITNI